MTYDMIIVGGGPAGATLARLAPRSWRILLLAGTGRDKPCGGLLAPDAQKALARFELTLPKAVLVDPQIFSVRTIDLSTGRQRYYQRMYINVDRQRFDRWLLDMAGDNVTVVRGRCTRRRPAGVPGPPFGGGRRGGLHRPPHPLRPGEDPPVHRHPAVVPPGRRQPLLLLRLRRRHLPLLLLVYL